MQAFLSAGVSLSPKDEKLLVHVTDVKATCSDAGDIKVERPNSRT